MLGECPHCHGDNGVYVKAKAYGRAECYYDEFGNSQDINTDYLGFIRSKVVRCDKCNRIRKDLVCDGLDVIKAHSRD